MFHGKKCIVLGVTGGIAVYKAADLCSKLKQNNYDVHVVMTAHALRLISERIFFTLSGNPVLTDLFDVPDAQPNHVHLADIADLLVVAPCTANFIGKYANGIADDALTTTAITHPGQVLLAPAMNTNMWNHPALQTNLCLLRQRGVHFVGPESGMLACGVIGIGRMSPPDTILEAIRNILL